MANPLSRDMAQAAQHIAAILSRDAARIVALEKQGPASPAISDLVYRGLRGWGLAMTRLSRMAKHMPEPKIQALLAIAWAALHEQMREPHIVVDQAANAAKAIAGEKAAGFLNALLRNTIRDPKAASDAEHPQAKWNAPVWWIEKIQHDWGSKADAVLHALHQRAPLTVRISERLQNDLAGYLDRLSSCGLKGQVIGPTAVSIDPPVSVHKIPGFAQGLVSVQDASAQQAACLFDGLFGRADAGAPMPDLLDACAAPGGKTIALAQRYAAKVWALDQSSTRLARLQADLPRVAQTLKGQVIPVVGSCLEPQAWPVDMPRAFDAILLDAPCSGSGVGRRHPEIAWKRSLEEISAVADIQRRMLDLLWGRLKPGGELAFVTCSVFLEEGEEQAQAFLERTPNASVQPSPGRLLPIASPETGHNQDGFFFAKFKKNPAPADIASDGRAGISGTPAGTGG